MGSRDEWLAQHPEVEARLAQHHAQEMRRRLLAHRHEARRRARLRVAILGTITVVVIIIAAIASHGG